MALPYKIPHVIVTISGADEDAIRTVELFIRHRLESTGVLMMGPTFPSELEEEIDFNLSTRVKMRGRSVAVRSINTAKKAVVTKPAAVKPKVKLRVKK